MQFGGFTKGIGSLSSLVVARTFTRQMRSVKRLFLATGTKPPPKRIYSWMKCPNPNHLAEPQLDFKDLTPLLSAEEATRYGLSQKLGLQSSSSSPPPRPVFLKSWLLLNPSMVQITAIILSPPPSHHKSIQSEWHLQKCIFTALSNPFRILRLHYFVFGYINFNFPYE